MYHSHQDGVSSGNRGQRAEVSVGALAEVGGQLSYRRSKLDRILLQKDLTQRSVGLLAGDRRGSFPNLGRAIGVGVLAVGTKMVKRTPRSSIRQHRCSVSM